LKIIQLIQKPQLRGAEIFACQLSNHLVDQGHEVIVITIFKGDSKLPFKGRIINMNRPLSKRFFDFKGWKQFNLIMKETQPDIIQLNAADTLKFAVSSKILYHWKAPLIFRNANKMGDFITSKLKWHLNNFYLSRVAYVISVSRECEKDFVKTFSFPQEKIRTVEIGVEDQILGEIPKDLTDIYKRGPVITHIGGFVPEKNHEGLINIIKSCYKNFPDIQLLLLSKGKLEKTVKTKVKDLGLESNVHFLGYRSDVLDILSHSRVFVLPSFIEGLPAVILEAMYCKTPVVAYNVGGIGEVVIQDQTGWLVEKDDELLFQNFLEKILSAGDRDLPQVFNAKKMISKYFMNDKIAERFTQCYYKVLEESGE